MSHNLQQVGPPTLFFSWWLNTCQSWRFRKKVKFNRNSTVYIRSHLKVCSIFVLAHSSCKQQACNTLSVSSRTKFTFIYLSWRSDRGQLKRRSGDGGCGTISGDRIMFIVCTSLSSIIHLRHVSTYALVEIYNSCWIKCYPISVMNTADIVTVTFSVAP